MLVQHTQYDGCGFPSSFRRQGITIHDIDYIEMVMFLPYVIKDFNYLCHTSEGGDINCRYLYIPHERIARKGLKESAP